MSDSVEQKPTHKVLAIIARIEDGLLVLMLSAMIVLAGMQIIMRNLFSTGFTETDSFLKVLVLWVGMLGAIVATRERRHISIDILSRYLSNKQRQISELVIDIFVVFVCGLLAFHSARMMLVDFEARSIAFSGVPTWLLESIMPFAFTIITLRYLMYSWQELGKLIGGRST